MDEVYYANSTVIEYGPKEFAKGLGRMFYVINPKDTVFENVEDVPNFYVQAWPYFFMFMVLEHIILKLEGKKGIRLNDGITSLSNGMFLEGGRFIWRGAEAYLYTWVYANYRLVELPWDNVSTWLIAALGVDFGYYWMHRACHEMHVLWAQHQVHHTSEDFNMGVGIRQSILQGWCGFIFYLPLALLIPPAQFVMHHQFSYLYMFWIHTETIKTLGPLEYFLNTPSHHRIHHGSNPYCIDVNYGGVLIIWDKLFGTFRPEKETDRIVYGLIYQQPSFNPLHLQTFYTKYVIQRFQEYEKWTHKFRAVFSRPSWKPGHSIRFKDMEEDPALHTRVKYDVILPKWCTAYLLMHYSFILYGFYQLFLLHMAMPSSTVIILTLYILGSLTVFGMILDASPRAPILETIRCVFTLFIMRWLTVNPLIQVLYIVSGLFWFVFVYNTVEIKHTKFSDKD
ncbi:alkylglycerol monooxygenase-like [Leguminivora glycinivorella]|uniref:alkylglycerol monooxygenase-like n=1 Tax=Leguminivora glycinivorella TaxID=1035111 RepID=UPI00200C7946|nr:alkylglycerol monooxygenase-like [Leguminivora glycinivorella]XP_048006697.1 alkylglycerol monooxygenase-like [Leguminivora glycinivorella]XP_048006698.1 alkylglycerol monooxygenase-like [Leguminivora glycinivorella]XP_048006699.1 alkylglycerol monooxygenase-like [Leguminivora glycinivorella]